MPPAKRIPPELSWLDRLRQRFEQLLSGRAPSDPLYLTNRTRVQRLKVAALIAVPVLLLGAVLLVGSTGMFHFTKVDTYEHTVAEAPPASDPKPITDLKPAPDLKANAVDLEVVNIHIVRDENPPVVTGMVRNNTNQKVESAVVSFYLADARGSLMGTETTRVRDVGAHDAVAFRAPLKSAKAEYVLVREVHSN